MSPVPDCQPVLARATLGDQLGDGFAMVDDGSGPTIKIFDGDLVVFDAEVLINRGQKIPGTVPMGDGVLAKLVGGADELAALNTAAGPDVGEGARPVIASGLLGAGGRAGVADACAGLVIDLRRAAEFAGDHHENTLGAAALANILDERAHGLIVGFGAKSHRVEYVMVNGMVVPIIYAAAQRAVELIGDNLHARFDQPPRKQKLLPPSVAPVAVTGAIAFFAEVEGIARS